MLFFILSLYLTFLYCSVHFLDKCVIQLRSTSYYTCAMLFTELPYKYKLLVTSLCELLYKKAYHQAERRLLQIIESIFTYSSQVGNHHRDEVATVIMIYTQFNILYNDWLRKKKIASSTELASLDNGEHTNYLLAHCSDPASMDDLLWELSDYLENPTARNKEEVSYQLLCYRKSLSY